MTERLRTASRGGRPGRRRDDFTQDTRAQAFALDRGLCSFTGRSLWILRWGADPAYEIDWVDHVVPCAHGGNGELENAATAGYASNHARGADPKPPAYIFRRGQPTAAFREQGFELDRTTRACVARMRTMHASDWYLNRAMWLVWMGAGVTSDRERGAARKRGPEHWAKVGVNMLTSWRERAAAGRVASLEERRLAPPPRRRTFDQALLLEIRSATGVDAFEDAIAQFLPMLREGVHAIERIGGADSPSERDDAIGWVNANAGVSPLLKARLRAYVASMRSRRAATTRSGV